MAETPLAVVSADWPELRPAPPCHAVSAVFGSSADLRSAFWGSVVKRNTNTQLLVSCQTSFNQLRTNNSSSSVRGMSHRCDGASCVSGRLRDVLSD